MLQAQEVVRRHRHWHQAGPSRIGVARDRGHVLLVCISVSRYRQLIFRRLKGRRVDEMGKEKGVSESIPLACTRTAKHHILVPATSRFDHQAVIFTLSSLTMATLHQIKMSEKATNGRRAAASDEDETRAASYRVSLLDMVWTFLGRRTTGEEEKGSARGI